MGATITVVRSAELRGRHGTYTVSIDGSAAGQLERGQTLSHQVGAGQHTVSVVRDAQHTSPTRKLNLADGDHVTLHVSFISERAAYVRSPTRPSDHLVLSTEPPEESTTAIPAHARTRLLLLAVGFAALAVGLLAPAGSVKQVGYAVWVVAVAVGFVLVVPHMRHLYRSPRADHAHRDRSRGDRP